MRKAFIYGLFDPRKENHAIVNEIRYIGQSIQIRVRMWEHISESKKGIKTYKCDWIRSLLTHNITPSHIIIEECDEKNVNEREMHLIAKYTVEGHRLTNATIGGEGATGLKMSSESNAKRSEKMKRIKRTEEWRKNISKGQIGKKLTKQHIENMKIGLLNSEKFAEAGRRKRGKRHSAEHCKNISIGTKGLKKTVEHRHNLSVSHKGKIPCRKTMEAAWEGCRNKIYSEEELQRKGISVKNAWKILKNLLNNQPDFRLQPGFKIKNIPKNLTYNFSSLRHLTSLNQLSE